MTVVYKRRVKPRLAKLACLPGGKTIGAIEAEVAARLDQLKDTCFGEAQKAVQRMTALAGALPRPPAPEDLRPFYGLCHEIVGLGSVADLAHAGRAALSLCRLLDGWTEGAPWRPAALEVHLSAIALLSRADSGLDPAGRERIVTGLNEVAERPSR